MLSVVHAAGTRPGKRESAWSSCQAIPGQHLSTTSRYSRRLARGTLQGLLGGQALLVLKEDDECKND